ncbi:phage tail protein [Sphingomonas sp. 3-13AW]|uniref:phage tail protein n=1 Tax=Sphingomonas sp. 3-13AW TaxID=3050450 RepID=UPI003BB6E92F
MKKPEGLRRLLLATALKDQAEKLQLYIDRGGVTCRRGRNLAFAYSYTLSVVVEGYTGDVDALMVPILAWVAEQQPDLLDKPPYEPFEFESELLDATSADVSINIKLTENVLVDRTGQREWSTRHLDEPVIEDAFPGVCGVSLVEALIAEASEPTP